VLGQALRGQLSAKIVKYRQVTVVCRIRFKSFHGVKAGRQTYDHKVIGLNPSGVVKTLKQEKPS